MLNNNDKQLLEKLKKTNPELDYLISKVTENYKFNICKFSHELRNPITLINSSLQLIESQHPEVKTFKFWNETLADIQYVRSLLDELSTYNQSDTLNMSQFSINELLDSICNTFQNDIATSSNTLTCKCREPLPSITGDVVKLREVITNLLRNAKEAIDQTEGCIEVSAKCVKNNFIQISISDNGCGIPIEYQETIFDPFVTHKYNGTGLGLAISKNIIEAHHGTITFDSKINTGTTFHITLPAFQKQ